MKVWMIAILIYSTASLASSERAVLHAEAQAQGVVDNAQTPEQYLSAAESLIKTTNARMQDKDLKKDAKGLVTRSEKFVGQTQFEAPDSSLDSLENGIDLGKLVAQYKNPLQSKEEREGNPLPSLMVFISLSMPDSLLEPLARQTAQAGGVLVINGFVNGNVSNTIHAMQELLEKTGVQVQINPNMFKLFEVKTVPEIVVTKDTLKPCYPGDGECTYKLPIHDRMRGNVTLYYALEQFSFNGDAQDKALEHLARLQSPQWSDINGGNQ
jgi:type-F conjugative transfer system pilin assembly protein TrbC